MLDPDSPYVAYCPPGTIEDTGETLDRGGHAYSCIHEHPVLEGTEQIILIDTTPIDLPPVTFAEHWWTAAGAKRYMADVLIPHRQYPCCPPIRSTE